MAERATPAATGHMCVADMPQYGPSPTILLQPCPRTQVYKATERASGTTVALKQMYLSEEGVLPPGVRREVAALRRLAGQPHILRLLDVRMQVKPDAA